MRKSEIFEIIYKELISKRKSDKLFTRNDLSNLISKHQKYSSFVYKHSDKKNKGKLTLYFIRGKKINDIISFKVDVNVLKKYLKYYII